MKAVSALLVVVGFALGQVSLSDLGAQQPPAQAPAEPREVQPPITPAQVAAATAVSDPVALPAASEAALKDVSEWLNVVRVAQQFAGAQCDQLASVRQLVQLRAVYTKKVEDRLPGYTVNWQTFALVAKAK